MITLGTGFLGFLQYFGIIKLAKEKAVERKQEQIQGAIGGTKDIDRLWEDLQDWYTDPPREGEIVWKPGNSLITTTTAGKLESDYKFVAVIAESSKTSANIFICVEASTGSVLHIDEKGSVNRSRPFESVPLLRDLKESRRVNPEQLRQQIQQSSISGLQGSNYLGVQTGDSPNVPDDDGPELVEEEGDSK